MPMNEQKDTFVARHDNRFVLHLALLILGLVVLGWVTAAGYWFLGIFALPPLVLVLVVLLAQLWRTRYAISAGFLEGRCGFQSVLVDLNNICQVQQNGTDALPPVDGYVPFALATPKLYVVYVQDKKKYRLELSPADPEGFLALLAQRMDEAKPE